jgi:threonine aldolase
VNGEPPDRRSPHRVLRELAEHTTPATMADRYGEGEILAALEARVAELLHHEAAVFMPSGTMAQQIALRIWSERAKLATIAFHPTSHLELYEESAYSVLHGLRAVRLGDSSNLLTLADLHAVKEPLAALLLELPQREVAGQLPSWEELTAIADWAGVHGVAMHMDGARLWEAGPYYQRTYGEIAALFDSVYVSFYKGLGGISGCALVGGAEFIEEARIWQVRHGGRLYALYPYALSASIGLEKRLPHIASFFVHARAIAEALKGIVGIDVNPDPPHSPLVQIFLRTPFDRAMAAVAELARDQQIWMFAPDQLKPTLIPGVQMFELTIGSATLEFKPDEIATLFESLMRD